jgi:hypothetical protein
MSALKSSASELAASRVIIPLVDVPVFGHQSIAQMIVNHRSPHAITSAVIPVSYRQAHHSGSSNVPRSLISTVRSSQISAATIGELITLDFILPPFFQHFILLFFSRHS